MLIVCKTCACSYHIPREILDEGGCRLRCVGCGEEWAISSGAVEEPPVVEGQRAAAPLAGRGAGLRPPPGELRAAPGWREETESGPQPRALFGRRAGARQTFAALAALTLIAAPMAALAARAALVRAVPAAARVFAAVGLPVNLLGLALENVHASIFDLGDRRVLVVEGAIVNLRDATTPTPNLRIALRDADKREIYSWTAPVAKGRLGPDEQLAFRSRLAAPPDGVGDVLVRFVAAADGRSAARD